MFLPVEIGLHHKEHVFYRIILLVVLLGMLGHIVCHILKVYLYFRIGTLQHTAVVVILHDEIHHSTDIIGGVSVLKFAGQGVENIFRLTGIVLFVHEKLFFNACHCCQGIGTTADFQSSPAT
ncbi:hypothetical protein [Prevotella sp. P5-50]|uniref:hypothetical protein n=1 Tax=Prevotella sp. P5-50 TaxID=2024217 RepID=UPI00352D2D9D